MTEATPLSGAEVGGFDAPPQPQDDIAQYKAISKWARRTISLRIHIKNPEKIFNTVYVPYLWARQAVQIFFGGAASGKSAFCAQRRVLGMAVEGRNFLCVRNVGDTLRDSTYAETIRAINQLQLQRYFAIHESRMEVECLLNNAMSFFRGLDKPSKLQSIVPRTGAITDIDMEEAMEISEEAGNQLALRMRGIHTTPVTKRITMRFNPTNRRHWIYKRYFEGRFGDRDKLYKSENLLILRTTYLDNQFLSDEDRKRIQAQELISPFYATVYRDGRWGLVEGVVFTRWRTEDVLANRALDGLAWRYGLDFGYGPDPAALVETARHNGIIYVRREISGYGWTNQTLADKIRPVVGGNVVVCDSAEPKSIAELRGAGIMAVPVRKRRGVAMGERSSVLFGIQWLQQYEIVVDKRCQGLINELSLYHWRQDKTGERVADPVDHDNHRIDALRYAWEDEMVPTAMPGAFAV